MAIDLHIIEPVGDFLPDILGWVEMVATLVDIAQTYSRADIDFAAIWLLLPRDDLKQRGFTRAVRPDHPNDTARRQQEGQVFEQQLVAIGLADALELDDLAAQPLWHLDDDLRLAGRAVILPCDQFLELLDTRLGLGLTPLGPGPDPFQLVIDRLLAASGLAVFLLQALGLLLQIGGVIAFIGEIFAAIEFEDPTHDIVEEVTIVGDHQDRTGIFLQMVFQPGHAFGIEMVGRFVQQENIGLLDQQPGQRDPALFAARQILNRRIGGRTAQCFHRDFKLIVERPAIDRVDLLLQRAHFLHQRVEIDVFGRIGHDVADLVETIHLVRNLAGAVLDVFQDIFVGVELRLLRQIADRDILARPGFTRKIRVDPGHDLDQGRLARAVRADDADLGPAIKLQVDVAQHRLGRAGEGLGHALHDIGILRGGGHGCCSSE